MDVNFNLATWLILWIPMPLIIIITFIEFILEMKRWSRKQ